MSNRHAYLIMAHHRPDLLQGLVRALDDERNDIFVHLDERSDIDPDDIHVEKSGLFFIPRMKVNWGGYSQIECTVRLLEAAVKNDTYAYYHLMTGASYPLRNQDELHDFFDAHLGEEFIQIDSFGCEERVRYFWAFNEIGKVDSANVLKKWSAKLLVHIQECIGVDLFKKYKMRLCKGLAYWSITHEFATYVLSKRSLIKKMMQHSWCGDEMFIHLLAYNSAFKDSLFSNEDGENTSLRFTTWSEEDKGEKRAGHNLEIQDMPRMLGSEALFALKFEGADGPKLIEIINKERNIIQ